MLADALRRTEPVHDDDFDELLSDAARVRSLSYWSKVESAQRAAQLLDEAGARRVLDVGAGCGKFCIVASLALGRRVWGVERRAVLVDEARQLARTLGADVELMTGTLETVDPSRFDGFYFFNPFGEYVADDVDRFDDAFPRSFDGYVRDARLVERWLRSAPLGTAVVTNHGLGGRIPAAYELRHAERCGRRMLRLWVKHREDDGGEAWFEVEDEVVDARELAALANSPEAEPLVAALCAPPPVRDTDVLP